MNPVTTTPKADRCPNCHAFLPLPEPEARHRRCDYCGVAVAIAQDPPPTAGNDLPKPPVASSSRGSGIGLWISLMTPLLLASSIYYSTQQGIQRAQRSLRPSPQVETGPSAKPQALGSATGERLSSRLSERPAAAESRSRPGSDSPRRSRLPVGDASLRNELCHISGMQMSAVVDANRDSTAACFTSELARFPKKVGLISDWEVEIDGLGHVHAARARLHLLDYQRSPQERESQPVALPGAAALRCAEGVIRGWAFPKYSPKDGARMRMRCSFNFVVKDL